MVRKAHCFWVRNFGVGDRGEEEQRSTLDGKKHLIIVESPSTCSLLTQSTTGTQQGCRFLGNLETGNAT